MKDKLVKTGHKKIYYRLRRAFTFFLCSVAVAGLASLPIVITYQVSNQLEAQKEVESSQSETSSSMESTQESSYAQELLSY